MGPEVSLVLAHAGGWDEALVLFGGPLIVFLVLRYMGRSGADAGASEEATGEQEDPPDDLPPGGG